MRLSYLRYSLKRVVDPHVVLEKESEELHLSLDLRSLLQHFVPTGGNRAAADPVTA